MEHIYKIWPWGLFHKKLRYILTLFYCWLRWYESTLRSSISFSGTVSDYGFQLTWKLLKTWKMSFPFFLEWGKNQRVWKKVLEPGKVREYEKKVVILLCIISHILIVWRFVKPETGLFWNLHNLSGRTLGIAYLFS